MASIKKTKTIGKGSQSFVRELNQSIFVLLDDGHEKAVRFLLTQPKKGEKIRDYFIRSGLKYKEVFDAVNIEGLPHAVQKQHQNNIAKILKEYGWQGKVDLHTRPQGAFDHPSAHFHLWGKQVTTDVYNLVKDYLVTNELTTLDRLKQMKNAKVIQKIAREDLPKGLKPEESAEPQSGEIVVLRRKSVAGKQLKEFVEQLESTNPKTAATVERISEKKVSVGQKLESLKKLLGKEEPIIKPSIQRQKAVGERLNSTVKELREQIEKLKTTLSTNH